MDIGVINSTMRKLQKMDVSKMEFEDQLRYMICVTEFAKKMKPVLDKYVQDDNDSDKDVADFIAKLMESIANEDKS